MNFEEIEQYAIDKISTQENHLFNYHFKLISLTCFGHPFANSIVQNCYLVEQRIEGYAKRLIDILASLNTKTIEHYDQLLQYIAELIVVGHLAGSLGIEWEFEEEPTSGDSKKNPEVSISNGELTILVEVKSPRFHSYQNTRVNSGLQIPTRINNGFKDVVEGVFGTKASLPRDNIVKDFLISANEKFKCFKIADNSVLSVLVIVWDDFIYEPISALKNEFTGLLTEESYFRKDGKAVKFEYVDNIVLLRHMTQVVRSTVDIPVTDGLKHPLDYGKRGIALPKVLLTVNDHSKKDILLDIFECERDKDLETFAEYKPQEAIMWFKLDKN
jgi:hypothetical protein